VGRLDSDVLQLWRGAQAIDHQFLLGLRGRYSFDEPVNLIGEASLSVTSESFTHAPPAGDHTLSRRK
jgi:hypothetical protein